MTRSSKRNLVLAMTTLFVLLAPSLAFVGGKGSGGGGKQAGNERPTENLSLNYGKVETTYTQKNKASPNLYKNAVQGKHYSKGSN
jgi:type VI protein secretion system component Hcp